MEQYFVEQTHPSNLMFMEEVTLDTSFDGVPEKRLVLKNLARADISSLNTTYEFIRMATSALPVFRIKV